MPWKFFTRDGAEKQVPASVVNPTARISAAGGQSLASGSLLGITLGTVAHDTDSMTGTANVITIQRAGRYLVEGNVGFSLSATAGIRGVYITVNGANVAHSGAMANTPTDYGGCAAVVVLALNAGDVVALYEFQDSGATLTTVAPFTHLSVTKIDGAVVSYVAVPGSLVGQELAYATNPSNLSITATTEVAAQTAVTAPSVTCDGSMAINVEFWADSISRGTTYAFLFLYDNGVSIGRVGVYAAGAAGTMGYVKVRLVPSAGAHVYSIRATVDAGTGSIVSGVGPGAATVNPMYIRVTRAA